MKNSPRLKSRLKRGFLRVARRYYWLDLLVERLNFWRRFQRAPFMKLRAAVAARYLRGRGIEIGALHMPLPLSRGIEIRYVDRITATQAQARYPELRLNRFTPVDLIDDGEVLSKIPAASLDFIIGNNLIEHSSNTLQTLENWLSKLRLEGIIYLAVPDGRFSFDEDRPLTPLAELLQDYAEGPHGSMAQNYEDWVRFVMKIPADEVKQVAETMLKERTDIHFHVWTSATFLAVLGHCQHELGWPIELEAFVKNGSEFIVVIRKVGEFVRTSTR